MPWFKVWDGLKNKTCRYLLHRYLGQFLEEKLNLEQLNVELYNGKATVKNVSLNVNALNELFEAQGWSVEVTRGTIGLITVTVPWNALMTNNSYIEISDLFICFRPVQRQNNGTSMLESMWSSVSSSLQLAQECMNQTDDDCNIEQIGQKESIDGLEKFAETIDNVLNRIRAKCSNVILKLEYLPKDCLHGIAVLIKINALNYQNNADNEKREEKISDCTGEAYTIENEDAFYNNVNILSTFATHNISLNDVCVYTEEFKVPNSNIDSAMSNLWEFTGKKYFSETFTEDSKEKSDNIDDKNSPEKSFEGKSESIPTPILSIKGKQRILLKMKQSEDIEGPKVIFDIELGEICLIVTPRQIHLLSQFCELFSDNENTSVPCKNVENLSSLVTNIESSRSRIKNYTSSMTGGLENQNIWGEIHDNKHSKPTESFGKRLDAKSEYQFCESISSSMSSSSTVTSSTRFQRKIPNIDICGDISKFNVRIAAVMAIILQEDILVEQNINMCTSPLNEKSQRDMLDIAEQCFFIFNSKIDKNNIGTNKNMCNKNHISLQIYPIMVDGIQQRNKSVLLLNMCITATTVDLQEILEDIPSPLIYFTRDENCYNIRPQITINMKSTAPFNSKCSDKRIIPPRTDFEIFLGKCLVELDISIYDRLSAIIGISPFKKYHQTRDQDTKKTSKDESLHSYTNAKINSGTIEIKLRFPIVDVRPIHDPDRVPWWKQNIRPDYLLLCLNEIHLTIGLNNFEIKANEVDVFYCESSMTKTHLLKVTGACDSTSLMDPIIEYPTIVIETPKVVEFRDCEKCNTECCNIDCCCLPFSAKRVCRQSDTIHSKHDVPEESETFVLPGETVEIRKFCDTTFKLSKLKIKIDLPSVTLQFGSKQLYEIIYNRLNSDLFMWEPCSPIFQNSLENQAELLIDQHINTDLLDTLYESAKATFSSFERTEDNEHMEYGDSNQRPAFGLNSSSENLEYNNFTKEKHNSLHENIKEGKLINKPITSKKRSLCSLEITIGKGSLSFFVPTRDIENQILPMELGKFIIKLNNLYIFFVSGLKSNKNLEYLCLNLNNLEVFHCGLMPVGFPTSLNMSSDLPPYMKSTFYKTPSCLTKGKAEGCIRRELLSVVIEINKMPEQKIKRLKITMGLQKTTLRHNPALPSQTWLCQLLDFLEIKDYPVSGYEPYGIISEMQLHLWDCAIDYRPKNFPFRSVIEIGAFNISSNIISSVIGCTLRFVAEECVLSIAPFDINIAYPDCEITAIPSSNLVPVLDIGLLDISLRLSDKSTERCPKLDFRTVIQGVHLRTCSDSGSALAQLISYITSDGDTLKSSDNTSSTSSIHSSIHAEDEILDRGVKKYLSADISDEQQEHVNKLMAEAVQEPLFSLEKSCIVSNESSNDNGIEVFYFPDEGHKSSSNDFSELLENQKNSETHLLPSSYTQEPDEYNDLLSFEENVMTNSYFGNTDITIEALPQIKEDLGDISAINKHCKESISNNYDDYCFIAEEEKSFMTNFGIKNVNIPDDPLRIVDNHFLVPISKPDLLKSPENFPMAENRYTLCEMTFTWYLYGGNDFPLSDGAANQSTNKAPCTSNKGCKSNMSEAYRHGVSYSKDTDSLLFGKKPKEKLTWKTIGGVNRHHEVLVEIQLSKVRFSHEVYPDYTTHASRQVLVINELEIRDRLQSSDINKFLYHPKSNNLPNKSNQNMIVLKALHVRPSPKINLSQECSLRISLLPLRFHIDQDTLLFLVDFFTNLGDNCKNEALQSGMDSKNNRNVSFRKGEIQDPVMKVDTVPEAVHDLYARRLVSENLDILMKDQKQSESKSMEMNTRDENSVIYFREVVFSPEVLIRLDYHGRRVELSRGPVTGLLMGLGQLQCSEIRLKKIVYKRGLLGFEKLITYLCKEWLRDIKKNQLPNILSGVGPTYAFIQLFQGIYDLFWLPIEQFQKDGRIIRGLQLGAQSFTARTALAALEITSRIIQLLQFTAETAFDMVSPGPTVGRQRISHKGRRKRQHRPKDIREGVTNAYIIMKEGFNDSAHKFIETAVAEHDQKGYTGAVGAVMRQIPQLVVCPAVLATQATTNILGGAKSSLVPEAKLEARDKWKDDTD